MTNKEAFAETPAVLPGTGSVRWLDYSDTITLDMGTALSAFVILWALGALLDVAEAFTGGRGGRSAALRQLSVWFWAGSLMALIPVVGLTFAWFLS